MENKNRLGYCCFEQRDKILADEYTIKRYLLRDVIVGSRRDDALVRLTTPIPLGEMANRGKQRLINLSRKLLMRLDRYLPG